MSRTFRSVLLLTTVGGIVLTASPAVAQILFPYDLSNAVARMDGGIVAGISLNSHGQTITSLGFYDHGDDGLATSYQIGLWDSSQTLVRTATVTPSSPLTSGFRYAAINPITLGTLANPETFTIAALLPANMQDTWFENVWSVLATGFTGAGYGQYSSPTGSLIYPATGSSPQVPYLIVNANGPAPPIPEPATLALVALASSSLLLMPRRRGQ